MEGEDPTCLVITNISVSVETPHSLPSDRFFPHFPFCCDFHHGNSTLSIAFVETLNKSFKKYDYVNGIHRGITSAALKWKIKIDESKTFRDFQYEGKASTRFGNRCIEQSTKVNYETNLKQLWRFCAILGDYDSMLLMVSPTPENAPAMRVETIEAFLRFKRQSSTDTDDEPHPLTTYQGGSYIKDIYGTTVITEGHWKNPNQANGYSAAINALHKANDHDGHYYDVCQNCCDGTCQAFPHQSLPRTFRSGNPTTHQIFANSMRQRKKDGANYREEGVTQLLPIDLRDLRSRLLSSQSIVDLQTWTIIIVSSCLLLRHDEFHSLCVDSFDQGLSCILENRLVSLAVKIQGKTDQQEVLLRLFADDDNPDLCPVRALSVYCYLIGIKDGYIFPSSIELVGDKNGEKRVTDGIFKTTICYSTFNDILKSLTKIALRPRRGGVKVGSHTFRKTGYLLAYWGGASDVELMQTARHKTQSIIPTYKKDAAGNLAIHEEIPHHLNRVSKWRSIIISGKGANAEFVNTLGGSIPKRFDEIGSFFVEQILQVSQWHPMAKSPKYLMEVAESYVAKKPPDQRIKDICARFGPVIGGELMEAISDYSTSLLKESRKREREQSGLVVKSILPMTETKIPQIPPAAKVAKLTEDPNINNGALDDGVLVLKNSLRYLATAKDKVTCMLSIEAKRREGEKVEKTFVSKFLTPTVKCINDHFNGDIVAFCTKYPKYTHTTFRAMHCCVAAQQNPSL